MSGLRARENRVHQSNENSFMENISLQKSLSLVSPEGFLFRLNNEERGKRQSQEGIRETDNAAERAASHPLQQNDNKSIGGKAVARDVSSIIQCSILQRRTRSITSPRKLEQLRIEGETKALSKTEYEIGRTHMFPRSLKAKQDEFKQLPPLKTYKTSLPLTTKKDNKHSRSVHSVQRTKMAELNEPLVSAGCYQLLPRKPIRNVHKYARKSSAHWTREHFDINETVSEREKSCKLTITVVLPAVTTDFEGPV